MNPNLSLPVKIAVLAAAMMSVVACNKQSDERTVGQQLDSAISSGEQQASEAKKDMQETGRAALNMAEDAAITTSVNAELAKDPQLSALKIDVDTQGGKVVLRGKAPDAASRERATHLASSVKGVTTVDNQLEIGS